MTQHSRFAHAGTSPAEGPRARSDRTRVSEYLDNIREIERRIQKAEKHAPRAICRCRETPIGVPESFEEHAKLMYDLQALAYQAEVTRVTTFMLARDLSMRTYPQIGVPEPFHPTSHHGNNPDKLEKLRRSITITSRSSPTSWRSWQPLQMAMARCSITR